MQKDTHQRKEVNKKKLCTQLPFIFLYQLQMSIYNPGHLDKCLTPIKTLRGSTGNKEKRSLS